mgnify:FL=1
MNHCDKSGNGYAWLDLDAGFCSILGYDCKIGQCDSTYISDLTLNPNSRCVAQTDMPKNGCPRVQRFSNDKYLYQGKKMGNSTNNNAGKMNSNLKQVAGFFPAMDCEQHWECNDNDPNTLDTCNFEKRVCVFTPRSLG